MSDRLPRRMSEAGPRPLTRRQEPERSALTRLAKVHLRMLAWAATNSFGAAGKLHCHTLGELRRRGSMRCVRVTVSIALRLASVPVEDGVGLWLARPTNTGYPIGPRGNGAACIGMQAVPTFAWWVCALSGAAAMVAVLCLSLAARHRTALVTGLRMATLPAGVGLGLWAAQLINPPGCPLLSGAHTCSWQHTFPIWLSALIGAGGATSVLLISMAIPRTPFSLPSGSPRNAVATR